MIVVFGANGNTGKVVASTLLERGKKVRVAVRDASKVKDLAARGAEVVSVDVEDGKSVGAALAGAEGVYLLVPPDLASTDLVGRGKRIVAAYVEGLAQTKVPHAVLLSSVAAQLPSGTGPIVIVHHAEQELSKLTATKNTFVRAAYFMENILANAGAMKGDGVLPVFGGGEGYAFPMIATHDIGLVAANALLEGPQKDPVIELSGPREYSFVDAAAIASDVVGKKVTPLVLPLDAMVPTLTKYGISENVAGLYREMTEAFGKGAGFEGTHRSVRGKVGLEEVFRAGLA